MNAENGDGDALALVTIGVEEGDFFESEDDGDMD